MTLSLAEGLVNAIVAYVVGNIAGKLLALDIEYAGSGITLVAPVVTYKGLKSLGTIDNYPAFYAISMRQDIQPLAASGGRGIEAMPEVSVGIVVLDQDMETLQIRLYRYGRALVELMLEGHAFAGLDSWNLMTDQRWAVDMETGLLDREGQSSDFVGEVSLTMRGNKIETKL